MKILVARRLPLSTNFSEYQKAKYLIEMTE